MVHLGGYLPTLLQILFQTYVAYDVVVVTKRLMRAMSSIHVWNRWFCNKSPVGAVEVRESLPLFSLYFTLITFHSIFSRCFELGVPHLAPEIETQFKEKIGMSLQCKPSFIEFSFVCHLLLSSNVHIRGGGDADVC